MTQSMEDVKKIPVYVSPVVHKQIVDLRRGGQTYGDVVAESIAYRLMSDSLLPEMFKNLKTIGSYPLLRPMPFIVYFDSENTVWCVENKELHILGCGNTYADIIASLEDEVDCYVTAFRKNRDALSPASLEFEKKLETYIDLDFALNVYAKKSGMKICANE